MIFEVKTLSRTFCASPVHFCQWI